ncbi:MAG TPA: hypothetical protein P5048_03445 [Chlamydiales bacterium]|nr:hypothetical protein [Chlamydiales bacterium]
MRRLVVSVFLIFLPITSFCQISLISIDHIIYQKEDRTIATYLLEKTNQKITFCVSTPYPEPSAPLPVSIFVSLRKSPMKALLNQPKHNRQILVCYEFNVKKQKMNELIFSKQGIFYLSKYTDEIAQYLKDLPYCNPRQMYFVGFAYKSIFIPSSYQLTF